MINVLELLICAIFGHRYIVERVLNHGARKVGCTRCGRHWAMHDATRSFVSWDGEFEEMYAPGGILAMEGQDCRANQEQEDGGVRPNANVTGLAPGKDEK